MSENQKVILINGLSQSWVSNKTGIGVFVYEFVKRLDKIENSKIKFYYIYDIEGANVVVDVKELKNITPIPVKNPKRNKKTGEPNRRLALLWRSKILKKYARELNATILCMGLEPVLCKNQITVIHDIRARITKYDPFKFRFKFLIFCLIAKHYCKNILTVSEYQKNLINKHLKIKKDGITVLYPGYEHMSDILPDNNVFKRFPEIKSKNYYLALGSLAPHKNFKWVIEIAKKNPNETFVIVGGKDLETWKDNIETRDIKNLIFTGYLTDEENKALYMNCKAFLHPSKFEGFGIPPLEALFLGAKVAVANATCLPEIYEDTVHYFDPDDYDVDLEKLFSEPVASPEKVLKKCSFDNNIKKLYDYLLEI